MAGDARISFQILSPVQRDLLQCHPIDTAIVAFKNEFHNCIGVSKHVCLIRVRSGHLVFERHRCRSGVLLAQALLGISIHAVLPKGL